MSKMIFIHKEAGQKKDAVRVTSVTDIPEFLKETITIDGNAATNLIEKNGVFYKKATVFEAQAVDNVFPEFLQGAPITQNADSSWTIKTSWGESTGFPGKAYWIRYGTKEDGTPDANILTKSEKSYTDYIVCDENSKDIGKLCEIDPA